MNRRWFLGGWLLCLSLSEASGDDSACIEIQVDPEYRSAILANEWLMEDGGVDAVTLPGEMEVLVGVGQVALKAGSTSADLLRARRVAESKATRSVSEYLRTDVSAVQTLLKRTADESTKVNGEWQDRSRRVEQYLTSHIDVRSRLLARIRRIGHWRSADGQYVYVAVAVKPLGSPD